LGFFNTGAYQENIGGFGGLKHCLIPEPQHILIKRNEEGKMVTEVFVKEQSADQYLKLLGYKKR
jgi:arginine decarboxylase